MQNDIIEQLLYGSGLTAQGCWDELDQYAREAIIRVIKMTVKDCAHRVNDYARSTGYTDHARMLCDKYNIEFKDEDFWNKE